MVQEVPEVGDYVCYGVALPPLLPPEYEGAAAAATKTPTISQTPLGPYPIIPSPTGSQGSVKAAHAKKGFFDAPIQAHSQSGAP